MIIKTTTTNPDNTTTLKYRFYFKPKNIYINNTDNSGSTRKLSALPTDSDGWWIEITSDTAAAPKSPSPFDSAWTFDHTNIDAYGGLQNDAIRGGLFSNSQIVFDSATNSNVSIVGGIRSAGCVWTSNGLDCSRPQPGYIAGAGTSLVTGDNSKLLSKLKSTGNISSIDGNAIFNAKKMDLTITNPPQAAAAKANGIDLSRYNTPYVSLYVGNATGEMLTSYDMTNSKWIEPIPTYQYIKVSEGRGGAAKVYRYGEDGELYLQSGTSWIDQKKKFNGVIYSQRLLHVVGPNRLSGGTAGDVDKMPPALASFAQMNIAAYNGMQLNNDITMSDTPCGYDNKWFHNGKLENQPGCPKSQAPKNALGLFSLGNNGATISSYNATTVKDVTYHAAIVTPGFDGTFSFTNGQTGALAAGQRHVVGAVIENTRGQSFRTTGRTGTTNDYTQDPRLKDLNLIPFNPYQTTTTPSSTVPIWKFSNSTNTSMSNTVWKQGKQ